MSDPTVRPGVVRPGAARSAAGARVRARYGSRPRRARTRTPPLPWAGRTSRARWAPWARSARRGSAPGWPKPEPATADLTTESAMAWEQTFEPVPRRPPGPVPAPAMGAAGPPAPMRAAAPAWGAPAPRAAATTFG